MIGHIAITTLANFLNILLARYTFVDILIILGLGLVFVFGIFIVIAACLPTPEQKEEKEEKKEIVITIKVHSPDNQDSQNAQDNQDSQDAQDNQDSNDNHNKQSEESHDNDDYKIETEKHLDDANSKALRILIEQYGNNILSETRFIRMLDDYQIFRDRKDMKTIIKIMIENGYMKKMLKEGTWNFKVESLSKELAQEHGLKEQTCDEVFKHLKYGLGW